MSSKLAIFLCSTYSDLVDERRAVLREAERLQVQHQAMETFGAHPDAPTEECLRRVRVSDTVIVLVGDRYGSVVPGRGVSFTEAEYLELLVLRLPELVGSPLSINALREDLQVRGYRTRAAREDGRMQADRRPS